MKTLFKQLSEDNQQEVIRRQNSRLIIALNTKTHMHQLTVLDLMDISSVLGTEFEILSTLKVFKS